MTRSVESTSIFSARSAGAGLLRQGTLRDGRPLASQPHTSRINTTLTNLSSSTTSTSTSTNHHHTHNPQDSPTIHHHHLSFSTSHAEKQSLQLSDHLTWVGVCPGAPLYTIVPPYFFSRIYTVLRHFRHSLPLGSSLSHQNTPR
jgi:hypothetical protein